VTFIQSGTIRYLTFDSFEGVPHAVVTRQGGVSTAQWTSLNLGGTVGDEPAHVAENRLRAFTAIGSQVESGFDVWQVHGTTVVCTNRPRLEGESYHQADGILTDVPGVTLFMRFADCVPILLWDPIAKVVGIVHAGWQGTVRQTVVYTIQKMQAQYQSKPGDILAAIGPSIAAHHYRVGAEVIHQAQSVFGVESELLLDHFENDPVLSAEFDLWKANSLMLEQVGVRSIEIAGICTACHLEDWYSHRGESGKTGRFGVLIKLPKNTL
jgi:polyphenol oxidase